MQCFVECMAHVLGVLHTVEWILEVFLYYILQVFLQEACTVMMIVTIEYSHVGVLDMIIYFEILHHGVSILNLWSLSLMLVCHTHIESL